MQESVANWAAACPTDPSAAARGSDDGGPEARAAAAAKAGNHKAAFLALAYGEVSSAVAAAAEGFEAGVALAEGERREAAASLRRAVVLEGPDGLLGGGSGGAGGGSPRGRSQLPSNLQPSPPPLPPPPPPPPLSRLAALRWEDIEGRRILLHVDLSTGVAEEENSGMGGGGGGDAQGLEAGGGRGGYRSANNGLFNDGGGEPFPDAIRLVAEQVRQMLSAKPAAVAIVSETAPSPVPAPATAAATAAAAENESKPLIAPPLPEDGLGASAPTSQQTAPPASGDPPGLASEPSAPPAAPGGGSLRASAAAVASLLGIEVDFYETVPELAAVLERCGGEGGSGADIGGGGGDVDVGGGVGPPPFGMVPLMMAERLSLPGVVPAPPVEEPELSDGEEERLPDFSWRGEGGLEVRAHVFDGLGFRPPLLLLSYPCWVFSGTSKENTSLNKRMFFAGGLISSMPAELFRPLCTCFTRTLLVSPSFTRSPRLHPTRAPTRNGEQNEPTAGFDCRV